MVEWSNSSSAGRAREVELDLRHTVWLPRPLWTMRKEKSALTASCMGFVVQKRYRGIIFEKETDIKPVLETQP